MILAQCSSTTTKPLDESEMIHRIRCGDHAAFEILVNRYRDMIRSVTQRFFRCEHEREDAIQETFISAHRGIAGFDQQSSLGTWLHRITINVCLMKLRSARRRQARCSLDDSLPNGDGTDTLHNRVAGDAQDPYAAIEAHETRQMVRDRIEQLPSTYRTVLFLRDIEELDTQETAHRLNCSTCNAKTRLHRARQALRTLLEPQWTPLD